MSALENPALDAATIRAIAREVARLSVPGGGLLTASEVALAFNVTRGWVYAHADELGAIRLGDGPRPRLRFEPAVVTRALRAGRDSRFERVTRFGRWRSVARGDGLRTGQRIDRDGQPIREDVHLPAHLRSPSRFRTASA